jgi:ABC-2 type transport system permease protein
MKPFYGVPVHGSLLLYFALTALYAFTNAGLGLLAGTFRWVAHLVLPTRH